MLVTFPAGPGICSLASFTSQWLGSSEAGLLDALRRTCGVQLPAPTSSRTPPPKVQSISLASWKVFLFFFRSQGVIVAQEPLKLALVVEAGLEPLLTFLTPLAKLFWDHKHASRAQV